MTTKQYTFAIDTDSYAGNFERSFLAYCTGVDYEYYPKDAGQLKELFVAEHGGIKSKQYLSARAKHLKYLEYRPHEEYGPSCFGIGATPGGKGEGVCGTVYFYLNAIPPQKIIDEWKTRAQELIDIMPHLKKDDPETFKFSQLPKKILGFRMLTHTTTVSEETI